MSDRSVLPGSSSGDMSWGGVRVEEVFLASLYEVLNFWEETMQIINQSHVIVTLKGRSKGDMG